MEVTELSRDQLTELKGNYLDERMDGSASWGEIADADRITLEGLERNASIVCAV